MRTLMKIVTLLAGQGASAPPAITTSSLVNATYGEEYTAQIAVTGGLAPLVYSIESGAPTGLTIDASTGAFNSAPTQGGVFASLVVRVTAADDQYDEVTLSLGVLPAQPTITAPAMASVLYDTTPDVTVSAAGGASSYDYEIASDITFDTIADSSINEGEDTTWTSEALTDNTQYFVRVYGRNAAGVGQASSVFTFSVSTITQYLVLGIEASEASAGSAPVTRYDVLGNNNATDGNTVASRQVTIGDNTYIFADLVAANDEYLRVLYAAALDHDTPTKMWGSTWVIFDAVASNRVLFTIGGTFANADAFAISVHSRSSDLLRLDVSNGTAATLATWGSTYTTGVPYHVVWWVDLDNNVIGLTINNATPVTTAFADTLTAGNFDIQIGGDGISGHSIDGVQGLTYLFYGAIPSGADIALLYNSGNGLQYPFIGGASVWQPGTPVSTVEELDGALVAAAYYPAPTEILMRGGVYDGEGVERTLPAGVTLRSYPGEFAKLAHMPMNTLGILRDIGVITLRGIRLIDGTHDDQEQLDTITLNTASAALLGCVLYDMQDGIHNFGSGATRISYNLGMNFGEKRISNDDWHVHFLYAFQNLDGTNREVQGNVIYPVGNHAFKISSSGGNNARNFHVLDNFILDGIYVANGILNGTQFHRNWVYDARVEWGSDFTDDTESTLAHDDNLYIDVNTVQNGLYIKHWLLITGTGNTYLNMAGFTADDVAMLAALGESAWYNPAGFSFVLEDTTYTNTATVQGLGVEVDSTFTSSADTTTRTKVIAFADKDADSPLYGYVYIYNPQLLSSVNVDLTDLNIPDATDIELHFGQDFYVDITDRTFATASPSVAFPMTGHTVHEQQSSYGDPFPWNPLFAPLIAAFAVTDADINWTEGMA